MGKVKGVAVVAALLVIAAAGCVVPPRAAAPPPAPAAVAAAALPPMVDLSAPPTLAEYVNTLLAYQGDHGAVLWLIHDTFGDRPALEHCFAAQPGDPSGIGIVWRESNDNTFSKNPGSDASGLTQQIGHSDVYAALHLPYDPFNPLYNLRVARSMAETHAGLVSGWQPLPGACSGV